MAFKKTGLGTPVRSWETPQQTSEQFGQLNGETVGSDVTSRDSRGKQTLRDQDTHGDKGTPGVFGVLSGPDRRVEKNNRLAGSPGGRAGPAVRSGSEVDGLRVG